MTPALSPDSKPICAISTPPGVGGIAVARISGSKAIETVDKIWHGAPLTRANTHTAHYGEIIDTDGSVLDTAVATIFRAPKSFTGEDTVELSIHGSRYIQTRLIALLVETGCQPAAAGEFTRRAFANGRLDLASAEAVADMIASDSKAAHSIAVRQLKGDYSQRLAGLREKLTELAALLELELDFSEEDVEFASRATLLATAQQVSDTLATLASSFKAGSAIKAGVPVAIVGAPNAGKSTLLNTLLAEERALVSPISGTTRDTIEECIDIDGIRFRLIDTAGLRTTDDTIEQLGIQRAIDKIATASIVIWLIDPTTGCEDSVGVNDIDGDSFGGLRISDHISPDATLIKVFNKSDLSTNQLPGYLHISAKNGTGVDTLRDALTAAARNGLPDETDMIVTNARHYRAITDAARAINSVIAALGAPHAAGSSAGNGGDAGDGGDGGVGNGGGATDYSGIAGYAVMGPDMISGDIIAQDLRQAIHHLGEITGEITTTDILTTIFSRFCIGK
ncbi:MAG: tRNA uridine-5-carboxymethylaminomethyl(34) synthesis GTPase MnmE [Muribaculaceae bacterium]|nr:tRNA uridine-5-carboxymethylaminomethyl(34) synthesis GTPase MnmE [Muribaculaceae bacterium]